MKRYNYILLSVLFGATALITSCQRDEEVIVSTITTNKPTYVHADNATISIDLDYNSVPKQYGICYGTDPKPTIKNSLALCADSVGQLCELLGLEATTTYYARAFVQNSNDVLYGNEISFTTAERLTESGHEYVDMGLSVKWATMNVGATIAEEGGMYFAWGEVEEKESYMWDNYQYGNSRTTLTKYCESEEYGTVDNKTMLDLLDDAAYMNWGGKWRMPTYNEWDELLRNSTWTWVEQNGVKGVRVRSTKNGNCIFLPTTGYKVGADLNNKDVIVGFWTSSLSKNGSYMSYGVSVENPSNTASFYGFNRYNGYPIRAVMDNAITPPAVDIPVVVTSAASEVTKNSAVVGGNVVSDGGLEVTERGVYYSMNANPIETGTKVECGSGLGKFTCNLTDLQTGATYYVCAYAKNKFGVAYGEEISFVCEGVPVVTTLQPTDISYTSATVGGNVTDDGGLEVTERGVVYGTNQNPTTADSKVTNGSRLGQFTCNLTDLQDGTTYYVRAYAINAKGTAYGEEVRFTTTSLKEGEGIENGYVYVDLGLSVKWATMNVGASNPEDYGDYFAWGETEPKEVYDWDTYKHCNGGSISLTKYNISSSYGTVDNKTQLDLTDDAARANWGGVWRMPTDAEMTELTNNCTWTWTTQNGVKGYKVTSMSNSNSIFLSAAGYRNDSSLYYAGSNGGYWSSSLSTDYPVSACRMYFDSSDVSRYSGSNRSYGRSVRPVCP
ncbi:MAG: hypothetical protein J6J55_02135 [Paludibacteraceae bacterium]|nr:hypothetical protein [Paludibacteraceae bacterium]